MRTQQPLSFISWNTESFLRDVLELLVLERKIDFYCYIFHLKEEEEKKDHFHVFILPSRVLDTDVLKPMFTQVVPGEQPIKVARISPSKWYDWYWYGLHDPRYLQQKCLDGRLHIYSKDDFKYNNEDLFTDLVLTTPKPKNPCDNLREAVVRKVPFDYLLDSGMIPINQIKQYECAYNKLLRIYDTRAFTRKQQEDFDFDRQQDNISFRDSFDRGVH